MGPFLLCPSVFVDYQITKACLRQSRSFTTQTPIKRGPATQREGRRHPPEPQHRGKLRPHSGRTPWWGHTCQPGPERHKAPGWEHVGLKAPGGGSAQSPVSSHKCHSSRSEGSHLLPPLPAASTAFLPITPLALVTLTPAPCITQTDAILTI